jgi:signal transduction histidine kinase
MLVLLNLFYIKNNGFFGPTAYFLFPSTFILMYFGIRKIILPLFVIIFLNIGIFTYMEVQQLIITLPYQSRSLQFLDLYISLLITITAIIIFLSGIIRINIKEQKIAQESNKLKTAFLANTSHDIRTPVSSILGFCTLLQDDDIAEEELQSFVSIIHSNSQQLLSLINDIFDISIIESGNFVLHPVAFDLNKLIKEIQLTFSQSIKSSRKDILLQAHYGLHHNQSIIYADSVRINQILNNLIQNAINHTKSGAIIYGYEKDLDTNTLLFYVKDTGAGIPSNMLEGIFERNITDVNKSNIKGTGLGLHISRSLVKLMKGKIWVYSKEGEGSHFFFRIPLYNKAEFSG